MSDVTEESLREAVQLGGYSGLAMGKSKVAARSGRPAQALFRTNGSAFQMLSNPLENAVKNT